MGDFLLLVSLAVYVWAVVGLVNPQVAKLPKRISSVGIWILSLVLAGACASLSSDDPSESEEAAAESAPPVSLETSPDPPVPEPVRTAWDTINFVDEFGDVTDVGAASDTVGPSRAVTFPYSDITSRLFVDCNRAWMRFSDAPNLTGGDISDGYTTYNVSVRVDGGSTARWRVIQSWGDNDLRFKNSSKAISALSGGETFAVALPWYGQDSAVFSWQLTGSSAAIQASCD